MTAGRRMMRVVWVVAMLGLLAEPGYGQAPAAGHAAPPGAVRAEHEELRLRRGGLDRDAVQARARRPVAARGLHVVQFDAAPDDADIASLLATGAQIVDYVPHHAFLVWSESDATLTAWTRANVPRLRQRFRFESADALAPALDGALADAAPVDVTIQFARDVGVSEADIERAEALADAVLVPAYTAAAGKYANLHARVRGSRLEAVAALASVVNVEPFVVPQRWGERQAQIVAGALAPGGAAPSGPGYLDFLASLDFSTDPADYPVIAVVDDGVDNGTAVPLAADFYTWGQSSNPSRLVFAVRPPGAQSNDAAGPDGHGTINASIIAGYNVSTGSAFADAAGFRYGLGLVPFGRIANVKVFAPNFDTGLGNTPMVADYYARGARISNNSWGADVFGAYNVLAQEYDALTRDAQPGFPGQQPMLFVFAAGNAGPNQQTISAPGSAKNVITVGAGETSNPAGAVGSGCGDGASDADDVRDMTRFSSRGPTADGRMKPDIVAPGTFVHGLASQPVFTGVGVCGPSSNDFQAPGDDALFPPGSEYTFSAGTSVATPAISGFAALAYEFLAREYGLAAPSPALVKAFLLHGAQHMTGHRANESLPGVHQGYGRADMGFSFDRTASRLLVDQSVVFGDPGERFEIVGEVVDPTRPVRVVLTWTDPPGPAFADAYVNDLDLEVEVDGIVFRGNNFSGAHSVPGGTPDSRNNTEAVFLPAGSEGLVRIEVTAVSLGGDGVPGNGDVTDQDFALVAYNVTNVTSRGAIYLDRPLYACGADVRVTVSDADLAGDGTVTVALGVASGDAETLLLVEAPPDSGVFDATIASEQGAPVADGTLQAIHGDVLTAVYEDADDGSGAPATAMATATFDCVAPVVSDLDLAATSSASVQISLTTDEPATVRVRYGLACDDLSGVLSSHGPATVHTVEVTGLDAETQYFWVIEVEDVAGNVTIEDAGGACFAVPTPVRPDYFVESFVTGFDLGFSTILFTPDGSASFYSACRSPASSFPTDPAGGTVLDLVDDTFVEVELGPGQEVALFGTAWSSLFVGSNGYLTFGSGDATFTESLAAHFAMPRIAALFDDLNPESGGSVSVRHLADRLAVTFANVPEFPNFGSNSFQIEMFYDGRIRITYLGMTAQDGIVGLSAGGGVPNDFHPFDFGTALVCIDSRGSVAFGESLYGCHDSATVHVADGDLAGEGNVAVVVESSSGDIEWLLLDEVDTTPGTFSAMLPLGLGVVAQGDGVLQVAPGATITATYEDEDDGSGVPAVVTGSASVLCTDSFVFFQGRRHPSAPRFRAFAPVGLEDEFRAANFGVRKVDRLGAPAAATLESFTDDVTHLREYRVREVRGQARFERVRDLRVRNRCGGLYLDLRRTEGVLVPARTATDAPPAPPEVDEHRVDNFLCYKATAQRRLTNGDRVAGLTKGTQVTLFDTVNGGVARRYDLRKVTRLCRPVAVSGNPEIVAGPTRGTPKPIAAVEVRNPAESLVCYTARLARKWIEQDGCGPSDPQDRGVTILPAQASHVAAVGLHSADGFEATVSSTRSEAEVCLPSLVDPFD